MKRTQATTAAGLMVGLFLVASAQAQPPMHGRGMMQGGAMMGADSAGCMPMMGMGMGMMAVRQIVPVDDGVIVVMGPKLIKFDKNLKKTNEVTLEFDEESMKKMLEQMQRMRATCQQLNAPSEDDEKE